MTELQWAGQDKRDTVACEIVHWVQVVKGKGQGGREEDNMLMELTSSKFDENLRKTADQLPGYQGLLDLEKAAPVPNTAVSYNGALKALPDSRLTTLMRSTQPLRL